jgi:predicted acetyltransferase
MTDKGANLDPQIRLIAAGLAEKPVLANLLELYMHDFCDFLNLELRPDGRFGYKELDLYWSDPDRYPFLVYVNERLAGFVLVRGVRNGSHATTAWDVVEFFILRSYRRRGIGIGVAHEVFRRFPGAWGVRVMESNRPACAFWKRAVAQFAGGTVESHLIERDGRMWNVFLFESRN